MRFLFVWIFFQSWTCHAQNVEERAWWISKTVKKLQGQVGLRDQAEFETWKNYSDSEIVDKALSSPKFKDTLLDFFLYYIGFKSDGATFPKKEGIIKGFDSIYEYSTAFSGVRLWEANEPIFKIFAPQEETFPVVPLSRIMRFKNNTQTYFTHDESVSFRQEYYTVYLKSLEKFAGVLSEVKTNTFSTICKNYEGLFNTIQYNEVMGLLLGVEGAGFLEKLYSDGYPPSECRSNNDEKRFASDKELKIFTNKHAVLKNIATTILTKNSENYYPQQFEEVSFNKMTRPPVPGELNRWKWFWGKVPNTSTNFNRKRSAFFLKRFFCDDLTPVNLETSESHGGNKHASDPACQSCHYKLDPMGGFFRYTASFGIENRSIKNIQFSDGISMPLEDYAAHWKAVMTSSAQSSENSTVKLEDGSPVWDVGYVRSAKIRGKNSYGKHPEDPTFTDLMEIMRDAPEVKKCFVRRAVEYMWGEDQTIDGSFLDELTQNYQLKADAHPKEAIKDLFKTLAMSKTFRASFADSSRCYDFGKDVDPNSRLPCQIAYVVEKNCVFCHTRADSAGALNLSVWGEVMPGKFGFRHLDENGKQRDPLQTFHIMSERLQSTDPNKRMPKKKFISDQDRDALYVWLQNQGNEM